MVAADSLDENDMVCDFKALKLALAEFIDRLDHALAVNSDDPMARGLGEVPGSRIVVFEGTDPTTEVLAKSIYDYLRARIAAGEEYVEDGSGYLLRRDLRVERVRVGETSSSWAEYGA